MKLSLITASLLAFAWMAAAPGIAQTVVSEHSPDGGHGSITSTTSGNATWVLGGQLGQQAWFMSWGNSGAETRKDDGHGPTLTEVKLSARLIQPAMLAPASYRAVAKQVGLDPSVSVDEARILSAIEESGAHVYNFDKVDGYLYRQALRQKSPSRWVWKPMRAADEKAVDGRAQSERVGVVSSSQYARALPMRVLENVKDVLDCMPDAIFLVSDYEVIRPDPFLAVTTKRLLDAGKIWIIDCWDEPGFSESK